MGHADNNIGNQNKHNILIYMLKVFSMFMVMFDYEKYDASTKLIGVTINYDNCNRYVYCHMTHKKFKETNQIFVKGVVFQHFGL